MRGTEHESTTRNGMGQDRAVVTAVAVGIVVFWSAAIWLGAGLLRALT